MTNNSLALHYAHRLQGRPWRECVTKGWQLVKFRELLRHGVMYFRYIKKDATIRVAYGTLKEDLIPAEQRPKGVIQRRPNYSSFAYYDLVRNEWRSFSITMFLFDSVRPCHAVWVPDEEE